MSPEGPGYPSKNTIKIGLILFFSLFLLYVFLGTHLERAASHPYKYYDVLFELDTPRVIGDMTDFHADHFRTKVHPLYVLFVNPIGVLLTKLVKNREAFFSIALGSFFASLSAFLSFILFRRMTQSVVKPLCLSLIFACSMSQFILSCVPETASLATLSLLVTYTVFWTDLYRRRVPLAVWVLCGIFSFGVTTTNLAQTLVCFGVSRLALSQGSWKKSLKPVLLFMGSVVSITAVLAVVQKLIYRSSGLFFKMSSYQEDMRYTSIGILAHPVKIAGQLFKHFCIVNVIGPFPHETEIGKRPLPSLTFSTSWDFSMFGYAALLLWTALIVTGIDTDHFKKFKWFYAGLALCVLGNLTLHSFYGTGSDGNTAYFLYTGNFTFAVIALFSIKHLYSPKKFSTVGLVLLCLTLAANNLTVFRHMIQFYEQAKPLQTAAQTA